MSTISKGAAFVELSLEEPTHAMSKISYSFKLFAEFVRFAREHKVYWVIPLVLFLGLVALVVVGGQSAAPLLYTLF